MTPLILWLDTETYNEKPIKHGTYAYTETCEVDIISYAFGNDAVGVLDVANGPRSDVLYWESQAQKADIIVAHNAMFDRNALRLGNLKIDIPVEKWRCSMVHAMSHGLPGSLDKLGGIMGIHEDFKKLQEGRALMQLFCKPRPRNSKLRRATKHTHPAEWARYLEYARGDVVAMRAIMAKLPSWNFTIDPPGKNRPRDLELAHWHRDQRINDRGFRVDLALVDGALRAVAQEQARLKIQTREETGYDGQGAGLGSTSQRDAMLDYLLQQHGVMLPDLKSDTLERRLTDPDLDEGVKELLRIRLQVSSTSTAKYNSLKNGTSQDGRMRGTIQFDGAQRTRRAAGRTFQPQNLPSRGLLPQNEIDLGVECLLAGTEDLIFPDVMKLTTSTIRACVAPSRGKKLVVADLSNIEGRGLAWLAGEEWKLQAFRDFDEGTGPDLYKLAYAKAFRIRHEDVAKSQRSIGKVMELGLGYAGGVNAFVTFAMVYGIDLEEMADNAWDSLPEDTVREAEDFLDWQASVGTVHPMSRKAATTCEVFKRLWRAAHPATVALWAGLEGLFRQAVEDPGVVYKFGRFTARRDGAWLRIVLPSGRSLCYPFPKLDGKECSFMGINQYTRKWQRLKTYSGKLTENCIAEGTLVLTQGGWTPIENVTTSLVWDGVEWVRHSGCIYKGKQAVLTVFGVAMTPEHRVLTEEGWTHASSCKGHNRAPCRIPYGGALPGFRRDEVVVGSALRLREGTSDGPVRTEKAGETGNRRFLRVHAKGQHIRQAHPAWHESAPGLRRVAEHARPLSVTDAPVVEELRREGDTGLSKLVRVVRKLLGGYVGRVRNRCDPGAHGQQRGVLPGELPVENTQAPGEQHQGKPPHTDSVGGYDRGAGGGEERVEVLNAAVPGGQPVASGEDVRAVYDILDCGPRQRFVVLGCDGPVIVHNCTQSFARDILYDAMPMIEDAGYNIVLHVHDEAVTEAPDTDEFTAEHLSALLATPPSYALDMPLAAAGYESYRYKKD